MTKLPERTSPETETLLPLQYEDGPDYCTVKDVRGRDFALTMQPDLMKAMERALRVEMAELVRPPINDLARSIKQYAYDLRHNASGGDDYPYDLMKGVADYLESLIKRAKGDCSCARAGFPDSCDNCDTFGHAQTPRRRLWGPEEVAAAQQAIMRHPHFDGNAATAFGFANSALQAVSRTPSDTSTVGNSK